MLRPESVFMGRDNALLAELLAFYALPGARVLDCTANARRMWKGIECNPVPVFMDIDPSVAPDVVGDFRAMPFGPASFDVIVFDPPHLPAAAASKMAMPQMVEDYGLNHAPKADNVSAYFAPFLAEAQRVLTADGVVFAKLKDFVHNHRYQWTLAD